MCYLWGSSLAGQEDGWQTPPGKNDKEAVYTGMSMALQIQRELCLDTGPAIMKAMRSQNLRPGTSLPHLLAGTSSTTLQMQTTWSFLCRGFEEAKVSGKNLTASQLSRARVGMALGEEVPQGTLWVVPVSERKENQIEASWDLELKRNRWCENQPRPQKGSWGKAERKRSQNVLE
ncbi:hypothetical protein P7K49_028538 [Saguinus oedipus]|uniref:Uncharacterized protein n=1 Tax=Saguinus oedipus TaxID=9490 RepID=A0ABQ9U5F0_SAGOE|nr:hypothetical protein P7K49_028538 [Saguinus oedipus]